MRNISAGLAITLDGVTDAPQEWMRHNDQTARVMLDGLDRSDTILLGRRTYESFAQLWPSLGDTNPMAAFMNETPKYILSSTLREPLGWTNSTLVNRPLGAFVAELKSVPGKDVQVPGSPRLVHSLLREGLLDELSLLLHPFVRGKGSRLFDELSDVGFDLVEAEPLDNGVLSLRYRKAK